MSKVFAALFIAYVARALCIRTANNSQAQRSSAFVLPTTTPSASDITARRLTRQGAEAVSSSNEPLPYTSGYFPPVAPGDIKYMGHALDGALKPANNYVLIVKTNAHEYSAGGVYIGSTPNKEFAGRIIAVGPGKVSPETGAVIPMSVKVGDIVLYDPPEERSVITYKKQECVLVTEDQIYARVECDSGGSRPLAASDIRPLSDRILVRVIDSPKKTQSGLVLANSDDVAGTIFRATIVAVGPGAYTPDGKLIPLDNFQPGDTVLFSDAAADGGEFNLNRSQHAFVRRSAVLAKV
ncbi:putative chaperonin [Babesia sp. Xinjiang]|uniref:putative chaperonin n=1 Tax=Babesia sp. Xinjiang TaxID=462227 RepID=UPI000A225BE4|nr:putative chaperonin [Babesia sp. Xinjiang]ORM40182.1 putative chaperonin [Babesia sp. Xinjiang]